jgi:hypothetical protein
MRNRLFMILFLLYDSVNGQGTMGLEGYYYTGHRLSSAWVPKIDYESSNRWYGEARYNYEAEQSLSLYAGRTFRKRDTLSYCITPLAGIVIGKFKGAAVGMNMGLDYKNLFFSAAPEYIFSGEKENGSFFFNWSELVYQITKHICAGFALQQTCVHNTMMLWEPGIEAGISFGEWTFPVYAFNPAGNKRYFILGVAREWEHHKKP